LTVDRGGLGGDDSVGVVEGVFHVGVGVGGLMGLQDGNVLSEGSDVGGALCRLGGTAVDEEDAGAAGGGVVGGGGVHYRDATVGSGGVSVALDLYAQRSAVGQAGGGGEGVERRLPTGRPAGFGHDRGDDVDELGHAGGADPVGVA